MLLRFVGFILLHESDDLVLPVGGIRAGFVADFVEHVVQIVDGVDDPAEVSLLEGEHLLAHGRGHQRIEFQAAAVPVGIGIDPIHVVGSVEGMIGPGIQELDRPAFKEHDRGVRAPLAGRLDARPQALEVLRIKAGQVEFGLSVLG